MRMRKVTSSNIEAVGYSRASKALLVQFKPSKAGQLPPQYLYTGVPPKVAKALVEAESVGKYLHANVIGRFDAEKVEP